MSSSRKVCAIKHCTNDCESAPNKEFVAFPSGKSERQQTLLKKWHISVFGEFIPTGKRLFVCEDHFNMQEDMNNWMKHKMTGTRLNVKETCVPHLNMVPAATTTRPPQLTDSAKKRQMAFIRKHTKPKKLNFKDEESVLHVDSRASTSKQEVPSALTFYASGSSSEDSASEDVKGCEVHEMLINEDPRTFIGIDKVALKKLSFIFDGGNISIRDVYMTLEKLYLNLPNEYLSNLYDIAPGRVSVIFTNTLVHLAQELKRFVYWPTTLQIMRALPGEFFPKYRKVQSIIACFEIKIPEPQCDSTHALTWSSNEHTNTIKYFISVTPHGFINYISPGYGGRATVKEVIEISGYLDVLPNDCTVLADESFIGIEQLFLTKHCSLICPPSVSSISEMTQEEESESRAVAALRSIVERVIGRIRHYDLLKLETQMTESLIGSMDDMVSVVCALTNLDTSIM